MKGSQDRTAFTGGITRSFPADRSNNTKYCFILNSTKYVLLLSVLSFHPRVCQVDFFTELLSFCLDSPNANTAGRSFRTPPRLAGSERSVRADVCYVPLQGGSASGYYAAQGDDPRRNVLSLGCRVAGPQARSELLSVQGVACAFPNTTVNVIRSPPWELLLSRIGDDLMFALLRQHVVLQRLPNRCYMQASFKYVFTVQ